MQKLYVRCVFTLGKPEEDTDDGDENNNVIIIVAIVAAIAVVLIVVLAVCLHIRRQKIYREEKLRKVKKRSGEGKSHPKGITYQEKADKGGEEVDLKVFDNEAVCLDDNI